MNRYLILMLTLCVTAQIFCMEMTEPCSLYKLFPAAETIKKISYVVTTDHDDQGGQITTECYRAILKTNSIIAVQKNTTSHESTIPVTIDQAPQELLSASQASAIFDYFATTLWKQRDSINKPRKPWLRR